jgi:Lon protease-like protein
MSAEPPLPIYTLPLFPLHSVLFPKFPLQLHIFEERYKVMINGCIERDAPFGVVLIRAGEEVGTPAVPYDVGCAARILAVKRLEDGRMHLLAAGESRFRLLDYVEAELPYLIGRVELLEDRPSAEQGIPTLTTEVMELFRHYLSLLAERAHLPLPELELPDDPTSLAFCIASVAQFPLCDKQRLLEMRDTHARMQEEARLLRQQIEALEALQNPHTDETTLPLDFGAERWRHYRHNARN